MGVGRQQRGPFQGVRVKNSVKELLLHIRSHKHKASGQTIDDFKVAPDFFALGWGTGRLVVRVLLSASLSSVSLL